MQFLLGIVSGVALGWVLAKVRLTFASEDLTRVEALRHLLNGDRAA